MALDITRRVANMNAHGALTMRELFGFALAACLGALTTGCSADASSSSASGASTGADSGLVAVADSGAATPSDGGGRPTAQLMRNGSIKLTRSP